MTDYYVLGLETGLLGDSQEYELPNENMTEEEIERFEQGYDEGIEQYYEEQENNGYDGDYDEEFEIDCFIDENDNGNTIQ